VSTMWVVGQFEFGRRVTEAVLIILEPSKAPESPSAPQDWASSGNLDGTCTPRRVSD
jgi:hypothetical protein